MNGCFNCRADCDAGERYCGNCGADQETKNVVEATFGAEFSVERHVLMTVAVAALFAFSTELPTWATLVSWLRTFGVITIVIFFPTGYVLNGVWPLLPGLISISSAILGAERSVRRRALLAAFLTSPILFAAHGMSIANWRLAVLTYGLFFYLMGFAGRWEADRLDSRALHSGIGYLAPAVHAAVLRNSEARDGWTVRPLQILEQEVRSSDFLADFRSTLQIEIVDQRAKVIVRVTPYGQDLFVRCKSYMDLSGRRLWLLLGLIFSMVSSFIVRWVGTDLYAVLRSMWKILLHSKGARPTGAKELAVNLYDKAGQFAGIIPSFMIDGQFCLEEGVDRLVRDIVEALKVEAVEQSKAS